MAYNIYISAVRKLNFEFGLKNSQHVVDFSELWESQNFMFLSEADLV